MGQFAPFQDANQGLSGPDMRASSTDLIITCLPLRPACRNAFHLRQVLEAHPGRDACHLLRDILMRGCCCLLSCLGCLLPFLKPGARADGSGHPGSFLIPGDGDFPSRPDQLGGITQDACCCRRHPRKVAGLPLDDLQLLPPAQLQAAADSISNLPEPAQWQVHDLLVRPAVLAGDEIERLGNPAS